MKIKITEPVWRKIFPYRLHCSRPEWARQLAEGPKQPPFQPVSGGIPRRALNLPAQDTLIDLQILAGGAVPAEVGGHVLLLDAAPGLFVVEIEVHCLPQDPDHIVGVDVREGKAPAGALELVVGGDGVLQAAGLPHYGDSAVAHSDHLAQAAGTGPRRRKWRWTEARNR